MKPRIFIGSSTEGLDVAYAIQQNLEHDSEPTVWPQGAFVPSDYVLPALEEAVETYDFGIFVFTPDDVVEIRQERLSAIRDNVVFELGLFIGRLGRQRNYVVVPRGQEKLRVPTDLLGLVNSDYEPNRQDNNLIAATGPAANKIRQQVRQLGPRNKPTFEEAVVSRAREEARAKAPERINIPESVLEQLDKAADALPDKNSPFRKRATTRSLSDVWWPFQSAIVEQNELVKRYGLRTQSASILDSLEWLKIPKCLAEPDEQKGTNGSRSTEELGVSESFNGVYEYTSPISVEAKWMAGYRCHLCYNGNLISVVGHHIVAPGYEDQPWTHVVEQDFDITRPV